MSRKLIDGRMPIDMALSSRAGLEEERRLFYVAVTRASDVLHLYAPLRMPHHRRARDDRHSYAPLSRFIDDEVATALQVEELAPERSAIGSGWLEELTGRPGLVVGVTLPTPASDRAPWMRPRSGPEHDRCFRCGYVETERLFQVQPDHLAVVGVVADRQILPDYPTRNRPLSS